MLIWLELNTDNFSHLQGHRLQLLFLQVLRVPVWDHSGPSHSLTDVCSFKAQSYIIVLKIPIAASEVLSSY